MNSKDIAAAVVYKYFPPIRYAACQNVSFALLPYEADIIAVSEAGTVHEIEIKVSKSDLLADAKKMRWATHPNLLPPQVDYYWLAVPKELEAEAVKRAEEIGGGVFSVYSNEHGDMLCDKIKEPRRWIPKDAAPLTRRAYCNVRIEHVTAWRRGLQNRVWRLAAFRYWEIIFNRAKK